MSKEWKLVPVEPTDDMKEAGAPSCEYTGTVCAALCYEAMLAAAPVVEIKPAGWLYTEHSENGHPYKPDFSQSQWVSMPDTYQEQPVYLAPPELAELKAVVEQQKNLIASLRAELRESRSITTIPDGYCVMPRRLTAENGAKALLLGEFKVHATQECRECAELDEPDEHCEICDGEGEYCQHHMISWDQIKFIYSKAVEGLAASAEPATIEYRLLAAGDTIAATDEYLEDDATTWSPVRPGIFNGMKYIMGAMVPVRRAITSEEPANKESAQ